MSRRWIICILVLWSLLASLPLGLHWDGRKAAWLVERAEALESASPSTITPHSQYERAAPQKAQDLLAQIQARHGEPLPGYVGGRAFQNRERRLPPGRYREYDVNPKIRGHSRDAERIVVDQHSGKAYYSGDHYRTFTPLNETP
jgi:ribonuclease T1